MSQLILIEKSEGIATLTLNRRGKLNAIANAIKVEMFEALDNVKKDRSKSTGYNRSRESILSWR